MRADADLVIGSIASCREVPMLGMLIGTGAVIAMTTAAAADDPSFHESVAYRPSSPTILTQDHPVIPDCAPGTGGPKASLLSGTLRKPAAPAWN